MVGSNRFKTAKRMRLIACYILLSCVFVSVTFNGVNAQVETVAVTGAAAYALVDKVTEDAEQLMQDAAAKGDDLRIKIAADILRIIASVKSSLDDTVDKANVKLDGQQRSIVARLQTLISEVNSSLSTNREELQNSLEGLQQDISNKLPFGDAPLIIRARPYHLIKEKSEYLVLKVRGINLGRDYQKLEIFDKTFNSAGTIEGNTVSPVEAIFRVPMDEFSPNEDMQEILQATVIVDRSPDGWWDRLRGKRDVARLSFPLTLAPLHAGEMRVVAKTRTLVRGNDKTEKGTYWRGKQTGCTPYSYQPQPGWLIDVGSWRITGTRGEYGYVLHSRPGEVTPERFSLQVCVKVKHNKGTETAFVEWVEYQLIEKFDDVIVYDDKVSWFGRKAVELPENVVSISSRFENFLSHVEEASSNHRFSYANIDHDLTSGKVFISGRPDALN